MKTYHQKTYFTFLDELGKQFAVEMWGKRGNGMNYKILSGGIGGITVVTGTIRGGLCNKTQAQMVLTNYLNK